MDHSPLALPLICVPFPKACIKRQKIENFYSVTKPLQLSMLQHSWGGHPQQRNQGVMRPVTGRACLTVCNTLSPSPLSSLTPKIGTSAGCPPPIPDDPSVTCISNQ
ncbi:hypothetical protein NPIL_4931 [Nephila pilipes]|uniref:Uncharacterized protein n=1 Tax=Nephila pilipes TaxID=299642 RepID=A0A8X6TTM9_NEPPI|nr:hypothetical protein NPIL_4931 [Nephila pilipes]